MYKTCIIDGYIDEPTCLGVPPYISPYPRYITGAILSNNKKNLVEYFTIDQIRKNNDILKKISNFDIIIIIAGSSVPGRYLSGYPLGANEIERIIRNIKKPKKILCGPAAKYGFSRGGGRKTRDISHLFDYIIKGDPETFIYNFLDGKINENIIRKNSNSISKFAEIGSKIVKKHPNYPDYLICEIETYRGCTRSNVGGCSFCSEPEKGKPDFREIKDISSEIKKLYDNGILHFRLGNQPCFFSYKSKESGKKEFPRPNPEAIENLLLNIRKVAPQLKTLHIDNANPGIIARHPEESKDIANIIIRYHTSGDVAAFGVESVDPKVISENNLKADKKQIKSAIKILNDAGKKIGRNGMPELLPGLNFLYGLKGENKKTFTLNYEFLKELIKENLLVRRINVRQIIPIPNTKMYNLGIKIVLKHKSEFNHFKYLVKENIERKLLERMIPKATIIKEAYTEKHDGKLTFARQLGSYPLLIGIPGIFPLHKFIDVKIVDYGYRSITAIPHPININKVEKETIMAIPGIGKKRAKKIIANRPFKNNTSMINIIEDKNLKDELKKYL